MGKPRISLLKSSGKKIPWSGSKSWGFVKPGVSHLQRNHAARPKSCRFSMEVLVGLLNSTTGVPWFLGGLGHRSQCVLAVPSWEVSCSFLLHVHHLEFWGGEFPLGTRQSRLNSMGPSSGVSLAILGCGTVSCDSRCCVLQMRTAGVTVSRTLSPWSRRGVGTPTVRLTASTATRRIPSSRLGS